MVVSGLVWPIETANDDITICTKRGWGGVAWSRWLEKAADEEGAGARRLSTLPERWVPVVRSEASDE